MLKALEKNKEIILILIFAGFLRLVTLPLRALGIDENFTLSWISSEQMTELLIVEGFTPPLYYLLSSTLLPFDVLGIRTLSVALGLMSIIITYLFVNKAFGKRQALLTSLVLTVLPLHLFYSQHMRTYALTIVLFSAVIYLFHDFLTGRKRKTLLWLFLANTMLIYTNYVNAVILISQLLYIIFLKLSNNPPSHYKTYLLSIIASFVALMPWLYLVIGKTIPRSEWSIFDLPNLGYVAYKISTGVDVSTLLSVNWILLAAFPISIFLAFLGLKNIKNRGSIAAFILLPVIVSIAISFIQPISHFRFLSYLIIPFSVLVSGSLEGRYGKIRLLFFIILVIHWIFFDYLYMEISQLPGWNEHIGL